MVNQSLNIPQMIGARIKKKDPGAEVILFGSHARGDANEESDWDVLILIDKKKQTREVEDKYRDEMFKLELEVGQPISTLVFSKNDWYTNHTVTSLYKNIEREGVKLT